MSCRCRTKRKYILLLVARTNITSSKNVFTFCADAGQNVNTFFELVMLVRATRSFARLRDRNLGKAQRDTARAPFAGDDFQRFAAGKTELLGLGLRKHASHQRALLNVFISAMPPRSSSSCANISVDFAAMESATAVSMRCAFSTVAPCGLPYQPVGAIERTSVKTG